MFNTNSLSRLFFAGRANWSAGSFTRSSAWVCSKLVMTMKNAINWNTMSIIGVMSTSATAGSLFLNFIAESLGKLSKEIRSTKSEIRNKLKISNPNVQTDHAGFSC